jgi:hypothetical protein
MTIVFDIKIPTKKGMLYSMRVKRDQEYCCIIGTENTVEMSVDEAHCKLGMSIQATKAVAKTLNWKLTGAPEVCKACAEGKAKQKNIVARKKPSDDGDGRIFLDISSVNNTEYPEVENIPKPYWRIIVDESTQLKFSDFFSSKSGMIEPTCILINKWIASGKNIKIIRCDDGGENHALERRIKSLDWKLNINFEYTGRDTPRFVHDC